MGICMSAHILRSMKKQMAFRVGLVMNSYLGRLVCGSAQWNSIMTIIGNTKVVPQIQAPIVWFGIKVPITFDFRVGIFLFNQAKAMDEIEIMTWGGAAGVLLASMAFAISELNLPIFNIVGILAGWKTCLMPNGPIRFPGGLFSHKPFVGCPNRWIVFYCKYGIAWRFRFYVCMRAI